MAIAEHICTKDHKKTFNATASINNIKCKILEAEGTQYQKKHAADKLGLIMFKKLHI